MSLPNFADVRKTARFARQGVRSAALRGMPRRPARVCAMHLRWGTGQHVADCGAGARRLQGKGNAVEIDGRRDRSPAEGMREWHHMGTRLSRGVGAQGSVRLEKGRTV